MQHQRLPIAWVLATAVALIPSLVWAAPSDPMASLFKELGVNAQQSAAIQQIHAQTQPQIQAARETLHSDRANLHKQVASSEATDAQLRTLYAQVASDAANMHKLRFEMLLKLRAVLTPAQRQQAAQLMQQRHKQHGEHHDGEHHHGDEF